jgi:hypothetical protein
MLKNDKKMIKSKKISDYFLIKVTFCKNPNLCVCVGRVLKIHDPEKTDFSYELFKKGFPF